MRGYAFIEFENADIAVVVAEAMNGYMLMDRTLQCHVVLKSKVHDRIWQGAGRKFKRINWRQISRNQTNAEQNDDQKQRSKKARNQGRKRLATQLEELGIDYSYVVTKTAGAGAEGAGADGSSEKKSAKKKGGKKRKRSAGDEGEAAEVEEEEKVSGTGVPRAACAFWGRGREGGEG